MIGLIVFALAVVVVLLTSLIKQFGWDSNVTHVVAVVLSTIGGAIGVLAANGWDTSAFQGSTLLATALAVYAGSQLLYGFILKGTNPGKALDAKLTALGSHPTPGA